MWNILKKAFSRSPKPEIKKLKGEVISSSSSENPFGSKVVEMIDIKEFTYLSISGIVDVVIVNGETLSLKVEAKPYVDDKIGEIVQQRGKELYLSTPNNPETNNQWEYLRVIISGPNIKLRNIIAGGAARLVIDRLKTDTINIDMGGGSSVSISGSANESRIFCSGCSVFEGEWFITNKSSVDTGGTSIATVNVKDSLTATAGGVSKIRFKDSPRYVSQDASGISSIDRL